MADSKYKSKDLSQKQRLFVSKYVETGDVAKAAKFAGYKRSPAEVFSGLKHNKKVMDEIDRLMRIKENAQIATSQEVMQFFTQVMNGEIKDQFGIETSVADRTRAAQELAKRTVDIENRLKGVADSKVEISVDWGN